LTILVKFFCIFANNNITSEIAQNYLYHSTQEGKTMPTV